MANDRNESLRTDSIRPTFRGGYLERFLHLVEDIDQLSSIRQRDADAARAADHVLIGEDVPLGIDEYP